MDKHNLAFIDIETTGLNVLKQPAEVVPEEIADSISLALCRFLVTA